MTVNLKNPVRIELNEWGGVRHSVYLGNKHIGYILNPDGGKYYPENLDQERIVGPYLVKPDNPISMQHALARILNYYIETLEEVK